MLCDWCDTEATVFLLSDRASRDNVDHACAAHAEQYARDYRRAVPMRRPAVPAVDVVDLRDPAPAVVDLTDAAAHQDLPLAAEAARALRADAAPARPAADPA